MLIIVSMCTGNSLHPTRIGFNRQTSKISLALLTSALLITSDSCSLVSVIMFSLILRPSFSGWCRSVRSSAAVSQRSCRSPLNDRVSTTLNTITGKTLLDHYLDRVRIRCDSMVLTCAVPWEMMGGETDYWTAGYHHFIETFHKHNYWLPWSCSAPSVTLFETCNYTVTLTELEAHLIHDYITPCQPAAWICMLSLRRIIQGDLHWSVLGLPVKNHWWAS